MAQQLDGYGQETFLAKDEHKMEAIVGVSLTGIVVGYENNSSYKFYQWKDISNVINHKKHFGIECQAPEDNVQFEFPDPESAKYVWKLCVLQHTFYMQKEQIAENSAKSPLEKNMNNLQNVSSHNINNIFTQSEVSILFISFILTC